MIELAPGAFGYASVPAVNIPVALYIIAHDPFGDGLFPAWLIARSALRSDGDGQGYVVFSRRGREEILWYEWVELTELDPARRPRAPSTSQSIA